MLLRAVCVSFSFIVGEILADKKPEGDLQIVGSDSHYTFEPRGGLDDSDSPGYYGPSDDFNKPEFQDAGGETKVDFPVKTVQKFTDSDGNVKIVTSYSNHDDNPLPIYKDVALRQRGLQQARGVKVIGEPIKVIPATSFATTVTPIYASQVNGRSRPTKQEFSTIKTVKLPNQDGQLFANQRQTTMNDGKSSSYNQQASFKTNYKKPPPLNILSSTVSSIPITLNKKDVVINNTPLEEAGSSYVSDIEESGDDEPSFDGGGYEGGYEGGQGYAGGSNSYSSGTTDFNDDYGAGNGGSVVESHAGDVGPQVFEPHGDQGGYDEGPEAHHPHHHPHHHSHGGGHAFKKAHGASHHHGDKASKGQESGKGHKSQEKYEKGHSESHGHEQEKGGKKEEAGGKSGHVDEANEYAKGHSEAHGAKGQQQGNSKGHKKGHKTKGFRTVHHKDEYKKDEVFYDEEHDAGHHKGHGEDHHAHKHSKGGSKKKGHLNSGYKHNQKGFHGDKEKGHSYKNSKGHSGKHGSHHQHSHHKHHDKGAGHKGGEAHGHEEHKKHGQ